MTGHDLVQAVASLVGRTRPSSVLDARELTEELVLHFGPELQPHPRWWFHLWSNVGLQGAVVVLADLLEQNGRPQEALSALATQVLLERDEPGTFDQRGRERWLVEVVTKERG